MDTRRRAFEAVISDVYEPLQRYVRRRLPASDADEVLNDVLLVIWRRLEEVPDHARLPWTYGVARRCLANRHRSQRRHLRLLDRVHHATVAEAGIAEPGVGAAEVDPLLAAALDRLGDIDREVVRLWAWEELGPAEIATVMGMTPNAVSIRLHRLRRKLQADLGKTRGGAGHNVTGTTTETDR